MRVGHLELFVRDTVVSRRFYEEALGFEVATEQEGGVFVWLTSGEVEILLRPGQPPISPPTYQQAANAIVLYTDDMDKATERLAANGVAFDGDDGGCPTFRDPDGHWFQLVNPTG